MLASVALIPITWVAAATMVTASETVPVWQLIDYRLEISTLIHTGLKLKVKSPIIYLKKGHLWRISSYIWGRTLIFCCDENETWTDVKSCVLFVLQGLVYTYTESVL